MNISGNPHDLEQVDDDLSGRRDNKWTTIRYAISGWGTTVRLLAVLLVLFGPAYLTYLVVWLPHK
jgi:hypothetical protein